MKIKAYDDLFTIEEIAGIFKLSRGSIRNLIRKGEIPAIKIGKQYRIPESVIVNFYSQLPQTLDEKAAGFGIWKDRRDIGDGASYVRKIRKKEPGDIVEKVKELDTWEE